MNPARHDPAVDNDTSGEVRELARLVRLVLPDRPIRTILELGSRDGLTALQLSRQFDADVFAFECNPAGIERCRHNLRGSPRVELVERAVWDSNGAIEFHPVVGGDGLTATGVNVGASSAFVMNPEYAHEKTKQASIVVESVRLENWLVSAGVASPDLVWLDLQGAELHALRGLGAALAHASVIYTEVEFRPVYVGQPLFREIDGYLIAPGFSAVRLMNRNDWFGNALYVRRDLLARTPVSRRARLELLSLRDALDFWRWRLLQAKAKLGRRARSLRRK
ncbi:MAG: FkbM family methyltransferase [Chloroflexi bacterium]|nr:FkbM family methyltransferase [Chloroflexota bacterium]